MTSTQPQTDKTILFERFFDLYYPSVYKAIGRLTGLADKEEIEAITINVFADLWMHSDVLFSDERPTAFLYKVVLRHVFGYLKKQGFDEHILQLQNTLLIDPAHYTPLEEPSKESLIIRWLHKLKGQRKP